LVLQGFRAAFRVNDVAFFAFLEGLNSVTLFNEDGEQVTANEFYRAQRNNHSADSFAAIFVTVQLSSATEPHERTQKRVTSVHRTGKNDKLPRDSVFFCGKIAE